MLFLLFVYVKNEHLKRCPIIFNENFSLEPGPIFVKEIIFWMFFTFQLLHFNVLIDKKLEIRNLCF